MTIRTRSQEDSLPRMRDRHHAPDHSARRTPLALLTSILLLIASGSRNERGQGPFYSPHYHLVLALPLPKKEGVQ